MSFNLLSEPWIPVTLTSGQSIEVSLNDAFERAAEVRRVSCDLPTQSFAILRVMLAIVHDAIGFHSMDSILEVADEGLPTGRILDYLAGFADRFDLFHPERPFFQVADLRTSKGDASGLEKLIADVPNGSQFLTVRAGRGLQQITAADAARWLVHCQAFDPSGIRSAAVGDVETSGGKGYPIGPGWAGQIGGIVLHGSTLANTLVYNLTPTKKNPEDRPVWALASAQTEQRQLTPAHPGPVALLTWQSRRIRLVGDRDGVTGVVLAQGDKMTPQNRQDIEPMTSWRFSVPQTKKHGIPVYMPFKHDPERSGWRGAPHLVQDSLESQDGHLKTLPSHTIKTLGVLQGELDDQEVVQLELVGIDYGPQEATVAEVVHDSMSIRPSLLSPDGAQVRTMINDAIGQADTCVYAFGRLAGNLSRAAGDFDGVEGVEIRAKLSAWSALDATAREWISTLDAGTDSIAAHRDWEARIRTVLQEQAQRLVNSCSPAAVIGRATKHGYLTASKAESFFFKKLRETLPLAYETKTKESV